MHGEHGEETGGIADCAQSSGSVFDCHGSHETDTAPFWIMNLLKRRELYFKPPMHPLNVLANLMKRNAGVARFL